MCVLTEVAVYFSAASIYQINHGYSNYSGS